MSRWALAMVGFTLVAAACTSGDDEPQAASPSFVAAASTTTTTTLPPEPVALECELEDYPCSLDQVPEEILERSDALGEEVLDMFEAGASTEDAHAWLAGQPDMVEVVSGPDALRFRLDGGRGTTVRVLLLRAVHSQWRPRVLDQGPYPRSPHRQLSPCRPALRERLYASSETIRTTSRLWCCRLSLGSLRTSMTGAR